jgi:hypothetical protein
MLRNMDIEELYIDDSEVDRARERQDEKDV